MTFAIGFLAGVCDDFGFLRTRDVIYKIGPNTGRKIDGFDCGVEFFRR